MVQWREIREFPGYSVSDIGQVRNDETGRIMSLLVNQSGVVNVGLTKRLVQHKRSVALLVATAFLPQDPRDSFDTPINLDGDRYNNHASNLMWRPRWYAVKYFQQFRDGPQHFLGPIEDKATGEVYKSTWDAATTWGLLEKDIYLAILNHTYVSPTFQTFRVVTDIT